MKSTTLFRLISKLSLLLFVVSGVGAVLSAQQENPARPPAQQQQQQTDEMNQAAAASQAQVPDSESFSGKIVKSGDRLVFQDSIGESIYQVEDQNKVKPFEGKDVKITGAVDPSSKTIYIASIRPQ
jgi:uncharacterized protein YdeI (BOF family)